MTDGMGMGPATTMTAAVIDAPGCVRINDAPVPTPGPNDVILRVATTGVCGTDVAVFTGSYPATFPVIMGHEFSGSVAAVGEQVSDIQIGQRAIGEGSWVDPSSRDAATDGVVRLGRTTNGSFAEFVRVPRSAVHPIPETVSHLTAQSLTTLATAVHACDRAGTLVGKRVAIVGPGHAGNLLMQTCRVRGAESVTVVGTRQARLDLATRLGAQQTVCIDRDDPGAALARYRDAYDVVFESSGTASGLAACFDLVIPRGRVVVYGMIGGTLDGVPGLPLYTKELDVFGSNGGDDDYPAAIDLVLNGLIDVESIVTSVLPLHAVREGLAMALDRKDDHVRIVFTGSSS